MDSHAALTEAYYDPRNPVAFSGAHKIKKKFKYSIPEKNIQDWLDAQDAYNKHRMVRKKFPRLHYDVRNIDDVWEADLVDLRSLKSDNDGIQYLLVVIDVLSKYVWVEPLLNKEAKEIIKALKNIFKKSNNRVPAYFQSDKGSEFIAQEVRNFLTSKEIRFRVTRNPDIKAAIVERVNRTIKERMWRYFTFKKTHRYIDVLQRIVDSYNHSPHSSIGMRPSDVTIDNAQEAWTNIKKRHLPRRVSAFKYNVGDYVRISRAKGVFEKGYVSGWTEEIFEVSKVKQRQSLAVYELKDLQGEEIDGFFYEAELVKVSKLPDTFEIEEVLKTKGSGKNKKIFVKWRGYPSKFNSWVSSSDLTK